MSVIILAENEIFKRAVLVHNGKRIELVVPNYVVGFLKSGVGASDHKLFKRSHEGGNLLVPAHAADAVVTGGDNAEQFALSRSVACDGNGGMSVFLFKLYNVVKSRVGRDVAVADNKAGLEVFGALYHGRLVLHRLGTENEGNAALLGKSNGKLFRPKPTA